ncbi:alginate lyase family protein [Jannaschia sp. M317]|uniref:alginate lyase family protein n=1 Tax=Jannaschia sp. M317 TaxID=2867011 RepID=UPI0021A3E9E6|nr:alginate lyase family protein [Jannaschia sp. M317]UWQ19661.1 alginate lyase family protein [Jannaschia sp. M317]
MRGLTLTAALVLSTLGAPALAAACETSVTPVAGLAFASPYKGSDDRRATLNKQTASEARDALRPVDDFITALSRLTDPGEDAQTRADCALAQLADWARADALAALDSETARLTAGSRLAGLGLAARAAWPLARDGRAKADVAAWLSRRMVEQMTFWETATDGASRGNLRAWAALAGATIADLSDDPVMRGWSAWSLTYVACTATQAGALPQEMSRGPRAMHYQLHAVAPLVTGAAVLKGAGIDLTPRCDRALARVVDFTLDELDSGGARVAILTGETQTTFEAGGAKPFQLAWLEAWLALTPDARAERVAQPLRPLSYSKLGGDQSTLWSR